MIGFQLLKENPLMGGVLVNQECLVALLYQNVAAVQLTHQPPGNGLGHDQPGLLRLLLCGWNGRRRHGNRRRSGYGRRGNGGAGDDDRFPQMHGPFFRDFYRGGGCGFRPGTGSVLYGGGEGLKLFRSHGAEKVLFGRGYRGFGSRGLASGRQGNGLCGLLKLHLRPVGGFVQGGQNTIVHAVKDGFFVEKFHLRFRRMYIHIHGGGGNFQTQHAAGEFSGHDLVAVSLLQGGDQQPGFDGPVIDEEGLQIPAGTGVCGLGDIAGDGVFFPGAVHRDHGGAFPAIHAVNRRLQTSVAGGGEHLLSIPEEGDGTFRMGQGLKLYGGGDAAGFHGVRFHKLHPGGGIVKQIPDDDGGALRTSGLGLLQNISGFQMQADTGKRVLCFGEKINAADGGDGGEGFSPEAHGADGGQILRSSELGGGVAQEGHPGVLGVHAAAVVRDPKKGHAAIPDLYGDFGGAGVHGVFQQLLDHAGGALNHLARGDQVGNMGG